MTLVAGSLAPLSPTTRMGNVNHTSGPSMIAGGNGRNSSRANEALPIDRAGPNGTKPGSTMTRPLSLTVAAVAVLPLIVNVSGGVVSAPADSRVDDQVSSTARSTIVCCTPESAA